jgi:tight adherence protein B
VTMLALKYLSLALLMIAVVLFVQAPYRAVSAWWNRRIETYARWFSIELEAMFEEMSPALARRYITLMIGAAFVLGFLAGGGVAGRLALGTLFGVAGYFGPWAFVTYRRKKRLDTIDDQLVDALVMMSNALTAGLSLQQAFELVVREMRPPIADEVGRLVREIHLGRLMDDALRRMMERIPLEDVRLVVEAILTLRETGGNLSDTFEVIAQTVVERKKVQGKIKTMTAQGMTQGVLICTMPIALMILFSFIDPTYMQPFFTTPIGWMLLALVVVLDAMGMWLMVKLVKVDV